MSGGVGAGEGPRTLLVTATGGARGSEALAAALAVCAADERHPALLVEVGDGGRRRPTLLASPAARRCETNLGGTGAGVAARGLLCHLAAGEGPAGLERGVEAICGEAQCAASVLHVEPALWLRALEHPRLRAEAAVIRAELPRDRALVALAVRDLRARGMTVRVAPRPLGWAIGRRALAGVRIGGADEARLRRWAAVLLGGAARPAGRRAGSITGPRAAAREALPQ